ncbi:MAG: nucleoside-triphosphatase [Anaerolineales bacterium]
MAIKHSNFWLVVGDSGSGKTTFCQGVVAAARQMGVKVRGLLCPARFEGGQKVGIDALDLSSGERRPLGWHFALEEQPWFSSPPLKVGEWLLDPAVLEWGNRIFKQAIPCHLLLVDELGPLEFIEGKGWQAAFEALDSGKFHLALVTVRESLRYSAQRRWQIEGEIQLAKYISPQAAFESTMDKLWQSLGIANDPTT